MIQESTSSANCVNMRLLGQQWIAEVTVVRKSNRGGPNVKENLEFRAHIRVWDEKSKRDRCNSLLQKSDNNKYLPTIICVVSQSLF